MSEEGGRRHRASSRDVTTRRPAKKHPCGSATQVGPISRAPIPIPHWRVAHYPWRKLLVAEPPESAVAQDDLSRVGSRSQRVRLQVQLCAHQTLSVRDRDGELVRRA